MNFFTPQNGIPRFEVLTERDGSQYSCDFFAYPFNIGNLAAGASSITSVTIEADSYFEWQASTCYANLNGASEPISDSSLIPVTIQIKDGGSGRDLFFTKTPIGTVAGVGKLPFYLPQTRVFMSKSQVNLYATNFDGSDTYNNLWFVMLGRKIWPLGPRMPGRGP